MYLSTWFLTYIPYFTFFSINYNFNLFRIGKYIRDQIFLKTTLTIICILSSHLLNKKLNVNPFDLLFNMYGLLIYKCKEF